MLHLKPRLEQHLSSRSKVEKGVLEVPRAALRLACLQHLHNADQVVKAIGNGWKLNVSVRDFSPPSHGHLYSIVGGFSRLGTCMCAR